MALSAEDIARKAKNNTLTMREALEYGIAHPITSTGKESKSAAKRMQTLLNTGLNEMNIDPDMPFSELANPEIYKRFAIKRDVSGKKESASYVYLGQTLEYALDPVFQAYAVRGFTVDIGDGLEKALYPHVFGRRGVSGLTQRSGQGQARPMQGTITRQEMDGIYANGYAAIDSAGESKAQILKDSMDYHRATANRIDHLFGTGGIQKKDISFIRDENNNIVKVTVAEKIITSTDDHKGRFQMTYPADSHIGKLLIRNYESSPNQYVFNLTDGEYEAAFDKYLSPEWLKYEDRLPFTDLIEGQTSPATASRISSASVVRSAVPRMLNSEFKVPADIRKGIMGQKGGDVLNRFYEGIVVDEELGSIAEMYAFGDPRTFSGITGAGQGQQTYQGFTFELSEEARKAADDRAKAEAEAGTEEAGARAAEAKLKKAQGEKAYLDWLEGEEGQQYLEQLERENIRKATAKGEADAARAAARKAKIEDERARTSRINDPDPETIDDDDINARFQELADFLLDMKALTRVEDIGSKPLDQEPIEGEFIAADDDTAPSVRTPLVVEKALSEAEKAVKELPAPEQGGKKAKLQDLAEKGLAGVRRAVPFIRMAETAERAYEIYNDPTPITPANVAKDIGESVYGFDAYGTLVEGMSQLFGGKESYLDDIAKQPTPTTTGPSMSDQYKNLEETNNFLNFNKENGETR
jgi:hypothetical protein